MSENIPFDALMERLRLGDPEVAEHVFKEFGQRLINLARCRLGGNFRSKVDPEDIMQSVFKSFFRRQADNPFVLESWENLGSLLTVLTLRKCGFRNSYFRAQCRDVKRELAPRATTDDVRANWEAIAREPTPLEVAVFNETVSDLLRDLSPRDRAIVERSLQGLSVQEVSAEVNFTERTVQRVLARTKARLERLADDEPDSA